MPDKQKKASIREDANKYLSTGFKTLDTLLGGRGFLKESVVLIRGEPGTGKTTMAFQIAESAVNNQYHHLVFLCAEDKPEISLNQITESFWGKNYKDKLGDIKRWATLDIGELTRIWDSLADSVGKDIKKEKPGFIQTTELTPEERRALGQEQLDQIGLDDLLGSLWQWIMPEKQMPLLVVIDSLSALIYWAQRHFRAYDDRYMLLAIIRSFEARWEQMKIKPTVIFTAEEADGSRSKAAESYIADVVIELKRKSVASLKPITPEKSADWQEDLLFCQVLKGRGLHTQRRPCCYEFVFGQGIEFFPTYAAQGLISLFHENQPQLEVIQSLRSVDMPSSYPGVLVQEFTLSGLQRTFAVRRYVKRIPPRHPMLISHVDEYWVEVLKEAGLLYPISPDLLRFFSQRLDEKNQIIDELRKAKEKTYLDSKGNFIAVPQMGNVGMMIYRKDLLKEIDVKEPPETWEELQEICEKLKSEKLPHKLLLETQTYDTLLVTALELGWGHGAFWSTKKVGTGHENVRIELDVHNKNCFEDFVEAMTRLHQWIHRDGIVPLNSSVDPAKHPEADWAFARHWYSTWVDYRTRIDEQKNLPMVTFEDKAEFGVARIPISDSYRKQQNTASPKHHSGSGEWYLVIQANSENVELGIDLINNLMTARKVTERALSGVELPVLEKFYDAYGLVSCFGTDKTFSQMREMFAADARSRTEFAEYRKVGRILYGALQAIVTNKEIDVRKMVLEAFLRLDPTFKP